MRQVLIAEAFDEGAIRHFIENENNRGRPSFLYHNPPTAEDTTIAEGHLAEDAPRIRYVYQPQLSPEGIERITASGGFTGVIVKPKMVPENTNVMFGVRGGTGIDNFKAWAGKSGHILMNTPGQNATATAEYTVKALFHLLAPTDFSGISHKVTAEGYSSADLPETYVGQELKGKTVVVAGMGDIGLDVALKLKPFGVNVIGWGYTRANGTQSFSEEDAHNMGISWAATLEEALQGAEGLTIHMPGSAKGIINYALLSKMKPGAVVVNAARGPVIDAAGLDKALEENSIRGVAVDADWFGQEDDPLKPYIDLQAKHPGKNILLTPHLACDFNVETRYSVTLQALTQMSAALWDKLLYNCLSAIPEGYTSGGVTKPEGIGRVTQADIAFTIAHLCGETTITTLAKLLDKARNGEKLSPEEFAVFHSNLCAIASLPVAGRPAE